MESPKALEGGVLIRHKQSTCHQFQKVLFKCYEVDIQPWGVLNFARSFWYNIPFHPIIT